MQDSSLSNWTITADKVTGEALSAFLLSRSLKPDIAFILQESQTPVLKAQKGRLSLEPVLPIRIGAFFDSLSASQNGRHTPRRTAALDHPFFSLNVELGILSIKNAPPGREVRLTEKETGILSYLLEHQGRTVPRKELLAAVWEYAETVETHTLETHIYRLRQKIEQNPSEPEILLTRDNGYLLK